LRAPDNRDLRPLKVLLASRKTDLAKVQPVPNSRLRAKSASTQQAIRPKVQSR
jgi:hypothetical protein